jgi:2-keto-3-deoxy-L-rhamnonate aldolase RhmA
MCGRRRLHGEKAETVQHRRHTEREKEGSCVMANPIGPNRAKEMLARDELVLCMGVNQMRTPNIALIAAACGFDAIYIDLEHNPTSLETAASICIAALGAGITPIARVSSHDPHDATRILDCGAQGVMVPHVTSAAEAQAIVDSCRFAPVGHRSAAGTVPALGLCGAEARRDQPLAE